MLIAAVNIVGPRFAGAASYFVTSGLLTPKDHDAFDNAVERTLKLRDSMLPETIIVLLA